MKPEQRIAKYNSLCLWADLPRAIKALGRGHSRHTKLRELRARVVRRFLARSERPRIAAPDPMVRQLVLAYREYYCDALLDRAGVKGYEKRLLGAMNAICKAYGASAVKRNFADAERYLGRMLKARGYHALFGTVTPYRSLLIWRRQSRKSFRISLAEGQQQVTVVFLRQFVDLGWLHFATFGRYHVGGWAKKDALYCVEQAYRVGSSEFHASYLCHEAQHFADYKRFPKLRQADLEYRAKLAELVASRRPADLLRKFKLEAKRDKSLPHSYAAHCLLRELNPRDAIAPRAAELLKLHSLKLRRKGAKLVRGALEAHPSTDAETK